MKKITKRDVLFFFIGLFTMLIIVVIYDWTDFKEGFRAGVKAAKIENIDEGK